MTLTDQFDLSARNTLGLPSHARHGGVLPDAGAMIEALAFARDRGLPFHLLGGGSNCVLAPQIEAVVGVSGMTGRWIDTSAPDAVRVTACAGESWPGLVEWSVAQGVSGLENLAGIPGTVGAAPIQNIGAYGVELSDIFESLIAFDTETSAFRRFDKAACRFAYRHSRFKETPGRYIVTEVTLALPRPWRPVLRYAGLDALPAGSDARTIMQAVLALRGTKLPNWRETGNAGSFFHNPIVPEAEAARYAEVPGHAVEGGRKLSAGWLLEASGLRGYRCGDAGFSEQHALVLVNHGRATFDDVTRLAATAVERVRERFGVTLVQEPVTLG
ncbi:UDP-N-acetylmuramate dehydrogenase [Salipiger abyssi]|uniref:UDP-N-acetylmuramate dehydrogenase n=1 Tax=Salipiger abyssi TaxID=1250539 RepID=UPI00405A14FA